MERKQKDKIVAELSSRLAEVEAVVVTDFKGLDVTSMGALRRQVRQAGGEYRVVKNTLLKLAARGTDAEKLQDLYIGNNALGTTDGDAVSLAKALINFAKENDNLLIKGGILSGKIVTHEQIKQIADLPSREILLGKMLGALNAVPTNFVCVLNNVMSNFVYALAAIRDQKEQA